MISEQIDIVPNQQTEALSHPACHATALAAPEQAVMHENGIRFSMNGCLDQRPTGSHARHDFAHLDPALHLKAVGSVILESIGCEQHVECVQQFLASGSHVSIVAPTTCIAASDCARQVLQGECPLRVKRRLTSFKY